MAGTPDPEYVKARRVLLDALELLRDLFGKAEATGTEMVVRATEGLENPETMRASCRVLATALVAAVRGGTISPGPRRPR